MRTKIQRMVAATSVGAALGATLLVPSQGFAAEQKLSAQTDREITQSTGWDGKAPSRSLIAKVDRYVKLDRNRKFVLNVPASVAAADPAAFAEATEAINLANAVQLPANADVQDGTVTVLASHGGFSSHWWGFTVWLDHWATGRLVAGVAAGSGAAWVAAELTAWTGIGGLSGGAIAALLALGAGGILVCDWNDNGINIHIATIPTVVVWCWPR